MKHQSAVIDSAEIRRYQGKSIPTLIRLATLHFNRYVRLRDQDGDFFTCISCGAVKPIDVCNAGHFHSAGHNAATRFDPENCHSQCVRCNLYMSGNLLGYREGLIKKIGLPAVEALELRAKARGFKWDRASLIMTIIEYKEKCKQF